MATVTEIAIGAYEAAEAERREEWRREEARREQKKADKRAEAEREARGRVGIKQLGEWFPGVEWNYLETWEGCDVWESLDGVRLMTKPGTVTPRSSVFYVSSGPDTGHSLGLTRWQAPTGRDSRDDRAHTRRCRFVSSRPEGKGSSRERASGRLAKGGV